MIFDQPVVLVVDGIPAPQGSKKHVGGGRLVESSRLLPAWRRKVKTAAQDARDLHGTLDLPLHVDLLVILPRPGKSRFDRAPYDGEPCGPPDLDKLQRAVGDGLEAGGLLTDDSRIVAWTARKVWAGDRTGAVITITHASPINVTERWGITA